MQKQTCILPLCTQKRKSTCLYSKSTSKYTIGEILPFSSIWKAEYMFAENPSPFPPHRCPQSNLSTPPPGSRSVAAPHTLPWHDCCGMQGQTEEKIQAFFSWKWDISSWFMLAEELRCSFQPSAQDPFHLCLTFCIFSLVSVTKWSCSTLHLRALLQSLILQTLPWDTTL